MHGWVFVLVRDPMLRLRRKEMGSVVIKYRFGDGDHNTDDEFHITKLTITINEYRLFKLYYS